MKIEIIQEGMKCSNTGCKDDKDAKIEVEHIGSLDEELWVCSKCADIIAVIHLEEEEPCS